MNVFFFSFLLFDTWSAEFQLTDLIYWHNFSELSHSGSWFNFLFFHLTTPPPISSICNNRQTIIPTTLQFLRAVRHTAFLSHKPRGLYLLLFAVANTMQVYVTDQCIFGAGWQKARLQTFTFTRLNQSALVSWKQF